MRLRKSRLRSWTVLFLAFQLFLLQIPLTAMADTPPASPVALYVAPGGSDTNPGTLAAPFATLEKARDAIRALQGGAGLPAGGVTVYLRGGTYPRTASFVLSGAADSGTAEAPIVYRAYGNETVRITGGATLAPSAFQPVADQAILDRLPEEARGHVMQINMPAQGITAFGSIQHYGFGVAVTAPPPELFVNGAAMDLGRWPNEGYVQIDQVVDIGSVPRDGDKDNRPPTFTYTGDRPSRWSQANDIWMFGYWFWDWADGNLKIGQLDTANRKITAVRPSNYGVKAGQRYYYYNLLEEIDRPGEWYLDRTTGMLYLYPPAPLAGNDDIQFSLTDKALVKMTNVSHVSFRNLVFEASRGTAIEMSGGQGNLIADSRFANLGLYAVNIDSGSQHGITGSEIRGTGMGAIILNGGNRATLTPGGHYAENNHIYNYARIKKTYSPAVDLYGVGHRVANNLMHDAPHTAVLIHGNDHIIENNEIHDVLLETADAGAIYLGRNWTEQGTVIRNNYLHNIGHSEGYGGQIGIYFDDLASGTTAYGNVMRDVNRGFLIGGGRNNIVEDNLIVHAGRSVDFDDRGLGWAANFCTEGGVMRASLADMPYQDEPWSSRYPNLPGILTDSPCTPKYNVLKNNVIFDSIPMQIVPTVLQHGALENNLLVPSSEGDSLLMAEASGDYRVRYDADAAIKGFVNTDWEQIGLLDSYPYAPPGGAIGRLAIKTDKSHSGETIVPLQIDETVQLELKARTDDGFAVDLAGASVSFVSDDPLVASVDAQGIVHAQGDGTALITATVSKAGVQKSIGLYVFVGIDHLNKMTVKIDRQVLQTGETIPLQLAWVSHFGQAMELLADTTFESADPQVATVDAQGRITAVGTGNAVITVATEKDGVVKSETVDISVYDSVLQSVSIGSGTGILQVGEQAPIDVRAAMSNGTEIVPQPHQISFVIVDQSVLQADGQGGLVAVGAGRSLVEVKVTVNGLTKSGILALAVYPDTSTNVPNPWQVTHSAGKGGFASYAAGRFTVVSNADNIWGTADNYTFVHRDAELEAGYNLSISAAVESLYNSNKDAAAGIMLRESMDPGARHVSLRLTPSGSLLFIYRAATGGATSYISAGSVPFPAEIKLTREGDLFTAYLKTAGQWVKKASIPVSMTSEMQAGMTLFAHTHAAAYREATEAGFRDVVIERQSIDWSGVTIEDLDLSGNSTTLRAGQTAELAVKASLSSGAYLDLKDVAAATVAYASSNEAVVSVDAASGIVTAKKPGAAIVTATASLNGQTYSKKLAVIVYTEQKLYEGFDSNFSAWTVGDSTSRIDPVIATDKKRNGSGSLKIPYDRSFVSRKMATKPYGLAEMWFYDDGVPSKQAVVSLNGIIVGAIKGTSQTHYVLRVGSVLTATAVKRTTGWHQVVYDLVSETGTFKTYLDGELIDSRGDRGGVDAIILGDQWADNSISNMYYDDIGVFGIEDSAPPVTTSSIAGTESNGWYSGEVMLTLHAVDEQSAAVALTEYSFDGGATWLPYSGPVSLSQEGELTIHYRSADYAGNVESAKPITLRIDRTAPTAEVAYSSAGEGGAVTATITPNEPVAITNNGGSNSYTFLYNGSFTFEFVDQAGHAGTATAVVNNIASASSGAPGKPALSGDNGHDTGLLDGDYNISMNMWWGGNGRVYKLYENDVLIDTRILADMAPQAQSAVTAVSGRANGTYRYYAELTNAFGTTRSDELIVTVTQAAPGKPVLSHNNWDGDGSFAVSMNMWWGTNGTSYRLYENGVLIDEQALVAGTPQAQSAATAIQGRPAGVYEYRGELVNAAGVTVSDTITVHVAN